MKCSRCAAELPDSSTFCSRCGAVHPSGQLSASSFSYLPVGAPPWPTSIPARSAYAPGSATPAQALASRPVERPRRHVGTVMVSALILLIPLLLGIGGTLGVLASQGRFSSHSVAATTKKVPAASAQATPAPTTAAQGSQLPAPTSFKATSIKDVNIALEYPANWVQDAEQKSTTGISLGIHTPQQQQLGISFFVMRFSSSTSATITSADEIYQSNIQGFRQQTGVSNMQTVAPTSSAPVIGGANWAESDATFTNSNSVKVDLMSISAQHNKIYYNIVVFAPDAYYPQAMQTYIQHMFTTFKFLS